MSQHPHEAIIIENEPEDGANTGPSNRDPPQHQMLQGESNFSDGSGHLFTMYNEMAGEEDKKMAESWKADADGILVFVSFFLDMSLQVRPHLGCL